MRWVSGKYAATIVFFLWHPLKKKTDNSRRYSYANKWRDFLQCDFCDLSWWKLSLLCTGHNSLSYPLYDVCWKLDSAAGLSSVGTPITLGVKETLFDGLVKLESYWKFLIQSFVYSQLLFIHLLPCPLRFPRISSSSSTFKNWNESSPLGQVIVAVESCHWLCKEVRHCRHWEKRIFCVSKCVVPENSS